MTVASEFCGPTNLRWTGAETSFAAGFSADAAETVKVSYLPDATSVRVDLVLGVHFSVSGVRAGPVTVLPLALPPAPGALTILRDTPAIQDVEFENLRKFDNATHTHLHDRAAMRDAELRMRLGAAYDALENAGHLQNLADHVDIVSGEVDEDRAATEVARDVALSAAGTNLVNFSSRAVAALTVIPAILVTAITGGYTTAGDLGGARYSRVADEPSHAGKFQSSDGAWWELREAIVNQHMFGAKGDGVTDDTNALKAWLGYCKATGAYPKGAAGEHVISDTIQITIDADLSQLRLLHAAANGTAACRVGRKQATSGVVSVDDAWSRTIKTPKITNTNKVHGSGWTGFATAIGLEVATANNNEIYVEDIEGFGVGLAFSGYDNDGCAYNNVFLKTVAHNLTNVRVQPGDATGWSNENNIFGGRLTHWSGDVVSGTTDIEISCYPENAFEPNNNLFIKPSIEGDNTEVVALIQGRVNKIINPRIDRSTPGYIGFISDFDGQTTGNEIEGGYGLENLTIGFLGGHTSPGNTIRRAGFVSVHGSGGTAIAVTNQVTDGVAASHIVGYPAGSNVIAKHNTSGDYVYALHAKGLDGKRTGDAGIRVGLDFNDGRITLGNGSADFAYIEQFGGSLVFTGNVLPAEDSVYQLGTASDRFTVVYAVDDAINTSDAREKNWRGSLSEAELRVAKRLAKLVGVYQWLAAVAKKGEVRARLHVGVTAQAVSGAFEAEGLDGLRYGLLCLDKWEAQPAVLDQDGKVIRPAIEAGERYGVRYGELWAFVAAGFEARLSVLESNADLRHG